MAEAGFPTGPHDALLTRSIKAPRGDGTGRHRAGMDPVQKVTRAVLVATLIAVTGGLALKGLSNDTTASLVKDAPAVTAPGGGTATEYVTEPDSASPASSTTPSETPATTPAVAPPEPQTSDTPTTHPTTTVTITKKRTTATHTTAVDKNGEPLS